jgi:hypothetical protein
MDTLNFLHIALIASALERAQNTSTAVRTPELRPTAEAFLQNVNRIQAMKHLPTTLIALGNTFGKLEVVACLEVTGTPSHERNDPRLPNIQAAFYKLLGEATPTEGAESFANTMFYLSKLISFGGNVRTAIESLLSDMMVSAWTTFEVLAADLWVASLNANPKLGVIALGADVTPDDTEDDRRQKRKIKYEVSVWLLEKYDYNLKHNMGTLLRRKWDFARRDRAEEAYTKVFGKDSESELNAVFRDQKLQWLAAIRNVTVHNGGIADAEFLTLVEKHDTLGKVKEGERIPIDGSITGVIVAAAIERCIALIQFVDNKLSPTQT